MDPIVTIAGNGYALLIDSPVGVVAVTLTKTQADHLFDNGVNYVDEIPEDMDGAEEMVRALDVNLSGV